MPSKSYWHLFEKCYIDLTSQLYKNCRDQDAGQIKRRLKWGKIFHSCSRLTSELQSPKNFLSYFTLRPFHNMWWARWENGSHVALTEIRVGGSPQINPVPGLGFDIRSCEMMLLVWKVRRYRKKPGSSRNRIKQSQLATYVTQTAKLYRNRPPTTRQESFD